MKNKNKQTTELTKLWFRHETSENRTYPLNTLNRDFRCPVCKQEAKIIYNPNTDPALMIPSWANTHFDDLDLTEEQRNMAAEEITRRRKSIAEKGLTVKCGCGIRRHIPCGQMWNNVREIEHGITYNKETGTLSFYRLGLQYFTNRWAEADNAMMSTSVTERISVNTRTGKSYIYQKCVGTHLLHRIDWIDAESNFYDIHASSDSEAVLAFLTAAMKYLGLPVTVSKREYKDDTSYGFSCDGYETFVVSSGAAVRLVTELAVSPSLYIAYDSYTGKARFRSGIMFSQLESYGYGSWNFWRSPEFKKAQPRCLMDDEEYINMMCGKLGVLSSPRMKALYRQDPVFISMVHFLKSTGIRKPDNIYKLVRLLQDLAFSSFDIKQLKAFLKAFVRSCGETIASNKLVAFLTGREHHDHLECIRFIGDTVRMWNELQITRDAFDFTGTIREIHDKASVRLNEVKNANHAIPYTAAELARQGTYGGYTVSVVEDTHTLRNIGMFMHICVGSYRQMAMEKRTTIYCMTDRDGRYQACMEIVGNRLIQAKGCCNAMLDGDVAEAVRNWVHDKKISTANCGDYKYLCRNIECPGSETVA
jgi:hypothetical protein